MADFVIAALMDLAERHYEERIRLERIRDCSNPFHIADAKFLKLFRLPKSAVHHLIENLDGPRFHQGHIPKHLMVLTALHFYGHGSYQTPVGQDNFLGISQPTVSRCLTIVTQHMVNLLSPRHIRFPTSAAEKVLAKAGFQDLYGMPNTLGAVDGTHIAIAKPPITHPTAPGSLFYNRKGFYSINCQIICSASGIIIGLNPNYPGSTHDSAIWRASNIYKYLKNQFVRGERNQWLLGDKGYPLQPWLMTPMIPTTAAEENFNRCHIGARNVVEMCCGRLKNKFRCLHRHRCLHYSPEKASAIILACCTLYNMFKDVLTDDDQDEDIEGNDEPFVDLQDDDQNTDFLAEARAIQRALVNTHFNN